MSTFLDTNVPVRHLTGDPPDMAARATTYLKNASELVLCDLVLAEAVYVLESCYEVPRQRVAGAMRSLLAMPAMVVADPAILLRALDVYERDRIDFAEAYLVANAERTGVGTIASFDRSLDRLPTIIRLEP